MSAVAQLEEAVRVTRDTARAAVESEDTTVIMAALDQLTTLRRGVEEARGEITEFGPDLLRAALRAGVRPADLLSRPYSPPVVWRAARELGLTRDTRGE